MCKTGFGRGFISEGKSTSGVLFYFVRDVGKLPVSTSGAVLWEDRKSVFDLPSLQTGNTRGSMNYHHHISATDERGPIGRVGGVDAGSWMMQEAGPKGSKESTHLLMGVTEAATRGPITRSWRERRVAQDPGGEPSKGV